MPGIGTATIASPYSIERRSYGIYSHLELTLIPTCQVLGPQLAHIFDSHNHPVR